MPRSKRHILSNLDEVTHIANCAHCGKVKARKGSIRTKGKRWICSIAFELSTKPQTVFKKMYCENKCGFEIVDSGQLQVHHKDENDKNNSPDNLITLCINCHRAAHSNRIVRTYSAIHPMILNDSDKKGQSKHLLSNIDKEKRTADCANCGPVSLCISNRKDGRIVFYCGEARNKWTRPWIIYKKFNCDKCGYFPSDFGQLDCHHKDGNRSNNSSDNIRTLCGNCHFLEHCKYPLLMDFERGALEISLIPIVKPPKKPIGPRKRGKYIHDAENRRESYLKLEKPRIQQAAYKKKLLAAGFPECFFVEYDWRDNLPVW